MAQHAVAGDEKAEHSVEPALLTVETGSVQRKGKARAGTDKADQTRWEKELAECKVQRVPVWGLLEPSVRCWVWVVGGGTRFSGLERGDFTRTKAERTCR